MPCCARPSGSLRLATCAALRFLSAEDDLRAAFTEEQLANLQDESLDPMSYVDPALIDVLQELNR